MAASHNPVFDVAYGSGILGQAKQHGKVAGFRGSRNPSYAVGRLVYSRARGTLHYIYYNKTRSK